MFTGKQWLGVASIGAVTFTGGVALGHFLGKRKVREVITYNRPIGKITSVINDDDGLRVEGEISPDAAEALGFRRERLEDAVPVETVEEILFPPSTDGWDYEAERNTRERKHIYTIHIDEFKNDEMGYRQTTLTYYEGDDILVDELDTPIYGYQKFIGDVMDFGRGSGDPNTFYVRNEKEKTEYEVIRDKGLYSVEVLGLEVEAEYQEQDIKHSRYSTQRFRMD